MRIFIDIVENNQKFFMSRDGHKLPDKLYHVTPLETYEKYIKTEGLRKGEPEDDPDLEPWEQNDYVFMTDTANRAMFFGEHLTEPGAILQIDVTLDIAEHIIAGYGEFYRSTKSIPPQNIKLYKTFQPKENITEAAYDDKIRALKQRLPEYANLIDWAKPNLQRQDRIVWYLNFLERNIDLPDFMMKIELIHQNLPHFLNLDIAKINNFIFTNQTLDEILQKFTNIENQHARRQEIEHPRGRFSTNLGDVELLKFSDGSRWAKLNTAYCEKEGKSGRHCGNVEGKIQPSQRIISLRDKNDRVLLTFILYSNGTLGEMKGRFNNKPDMKYHPQILQLLMQPYIKGIGISKYGPDRDFSVFDLTNEQLKLIEKNKPILLASQIERNPIEILSAPDSIKNNKEFVDIAIKKMPAIKDLLGKFDQSKTESAWLETIQKHPKMAIYAPTTLPDYRKKLLIALKMSSDNSNVFYKIPNKYQRDLDFLKELVSIAPEYLKLDLTPNNLDNYIELVLAALESEKEWDPNEGEQSGVIRFINKDYIKNSGIPLEVFKLALDKNFANIQYIPNQYINQISDYEEKLMKYFLTYHNLAVSQGLGGNPDSFELGIVPPIKDIPKKYKYDFDFMDKLFRKAPSYLEHLEPNFPNYRKLAHSALTRQPMDLILINEKYRDLDMCVLAVQELLKNRFDKNRQQTEKFLNDIFEYIPINIHNQVKEKTGINRIIDFREEIELLKKYAGLRQLW